MFLVGPSVLVGDSLSDLLLLFFRLRSRVADTPPLTLTGGLLSEAASRGVAFRAVKAAAGFSAKATLSGLSEVRAEVAAAPVLPLLDDCDCVGGDFDPLRFVVVVVSLLSLVEFEVVVFFALSLSCLCMF